MKKTKNPFHMPVAQGNPAYIEPPHRFVNREYFIITYETNPILLQKIVPKGLKILAPVVKYEFIKMPDSSGFGSFVESGQVIPVTYNGKKGTFIHAMFLNDQPAITGGREIWGFPKKLGHPSLEIDGDTLLGTLDYGKVRVATGTMGYKFYPENTEIIQKFLGEPNFVIKTIPAPGGTAEICQLVRYSMTDITLHWAYSGPAALDLHPHALAPVAALPVKKVLSALHFMADLTLPYGEVVIDYLKK
ncbi:MAG: acetoacetate decarboxylase [Chlamydiota bacterium]